MTLAGDIIYEHEALNDTVRGELEEFLCEAVYAVLGPDSSTRLSNGLVADTLFQCLDLLVTTDEHKAKLVEFLNSTNADKDDE